MLLIKPDAPDAATRAYSQGKVAAVAPVHARMD